MVKREFRQSRVGCWFCNSNFGSPQKAQYNFMNFSKNIWCLKCKTEEMMLKLRKEIEIAHSYSLHWLRFERYYTKRTRFTCIATLTEIDGYRL
ncbi:hypothetical protein L1987_00725 [Smallanthus sonchifolius]|uniref:Uncharacterized protein n=1 Tax=Smallanthus sonchifolius TaxID=185202 RepID=A0ACB9K355_9ASTR|nr:hypothetical protein L1987_00725 [Smallanthus sonchifolius]